MRTTGFFLEHTKAGAKASSDVGKETQSWVSVHTELGETMPVSQIEQNCENVCIVRLWQKAIKNGYSALGGVWPTISLIGTSQRLHLLATYPHNHGRSSSSVPTGS
jgi:hypothetical protein